MNQDSPLSFFNHIDIFEKFATNQSFLVFIFNQKITFIQINEEGKLNGQSSIDYKIKYREPQIL